MEECIKKSQEEQYFALKIQLFGIILAAYGDYQNDGGSIFYK